MKDNSNLFDEDFKENAKETVDKVEKAANENKTLLGFALAAVGGLLIGNHIGKKHNRKLNKAAINAAKEAARSEYADELLKEAMRYSTK